jgi:glycosyltransferase involved in cell wall biosynthesis
VSRELPSFDLVVATVDRAAELERFLASVRAQGYPRVRVIVVDQSVASEPEGASPDASLLLLRSERGLSRARNAALPHLSADLVAFPDDDCVYPPRLLERVAGLFGADPALDGVTGRAQDATGGSSTSWKADAVKLTDTNLWNRAISFTIFLRREVVERLGAFDERLGLGSHEPWGSGEEIDYLIRAVRSGARIDYDPTLVVQHRVHVDDASVGLRDGSSVGYLLRKHSYPASTVARFLVRPIGGAVASLVHGDRARAAYHAATLRGRVRGYLGAKRSKTSA